MAVNQKTVGQTVVGSAAAVAAAAGGATGAHAQGAVTNWQGPYVGGQLGFSSLSSSPSESTTRIGTAHYTATSTDGTESVGTSSANTMNVGGQFGWNFQNQHFVFGPEAGFSWLGTSRAQSNGTMNRSYTNGANHYTYNGATQRSSRVTGVFELKGRVGWDFNGTLPYVTAGFALGRVSSSWTLNAPTTYGAPNSFATAKTSWEPGFVFGAGIEQQVGPGWSLRGEISWMDFASQKLANPVPNAAVFGPAVGMGGNPEFSDSVLSLTVGLNYRF